jgi:DNA-binding NtrC family response regulator
LLHLFTDNNKGSEAMKVLIVDADESMRNLLSKFLAREGFDVSVASSTKEASESFLKSKYDFVIVDENIYNRDQCSMRHFLSDVMPDAKVIYIAPFYALNEDIDFEDERIVKCGNKLFRISELKRLISEIKKSTT